MIQDPITATFFISVGIITVVIIATVIARRMKGKVSIHTERNVYSLSEHIRGTINITTAQRIEVNQCIVTLSCEEYYRHRSSSSSTNNSLTLFTTAYEIDSEDDILPGLTEKEFTFTLPERIERKRFFTDDSTLLGKLGSFVENAQQGQRRWTISVSIDCPGLDLGAHKTIQVNDS